MNKLFLLRQSCGEDNYSSLASPPWTVRKGTKLCYTYSPYSCLHVAVTSWSKCETIQRGKTNETNKQIKNKEVDGCFLPNGRHGALHFADDVKVFGRGRADDCVCFVRHLRLCVCRVLTEQRMNSVVSVRPRSCGQRAVREIFGKKNKKQANKTVFAPADGPHWSQSELRSLPWRLKHRERDMLEVPLKRVNVFVHTCVYWLNLCVYTG